MLRITPGRWVVAHGRVGIMVQPQVGEFHVVREDGTTEFVLHDVFSGVREARWEEIPLARRPTRLRATLLGYK